MKRITFFILTALSINLTICFAGEWETTLDVRERYQSFENYDFDDDIDDDKWQWNSRVYLKVKKNFTDNFHIYLQPQAVYIYTENFGGADTEFTQNDLYEAYLSLKTGPLTTKLGRQKLVYGDQRLLGHLGWKDVSRTFDGIKSSYKRENFVLDVFAVVPADIIRMSNAPAGSASGESLVNWRRRNLSGFYSTYNISKKNGIDLYLINWRHTENAGLAPNRNINTYGGRIFLNHRGADFTAEYVTQDGKWSKGVEQDGSALALKAGYTLDFWKTRVGVEYNHSPGDDDAADNKHSVFVFPYHTNHMHYGEMDFFSWANMKDTRISFKTKAFGKVLLMVDFHMFELDEATDDWLDVVGTGMINATYGPGNSAYKETDAGEEINVKAVYKFEKLSNLKLVLNYSEFSPGKAVKERNNNKADKAKFAYAFLQIAF